MSNESTKRGFITIASSVGNYQKMAGILCESYKSTTKEPLPFAVLTDKKGKWLDVFDDVIEVPNLSKSANDKFLLLKVSPYDETIYIDSDCIAFNDLNELFDYFSQSTDVSAFGKLYSIDNKNGWYSKKNLGKYSNKVTYVQDLHGGVYYFKKGETAEKVYSTSLDIMRNYESYKFRGFSKPSDEPVFALSMAINDCRVTERIGRAFAWLRRAENLKANFFTKKLDYCIEGMEAHNGLLIHFGTTRTIFPLYQIESKKVQYYEKYRKKWSVLYGIFATISSYLKSAYLCIITLPKVLKKRRGM